MRSPTRSTTNSITFSRRRLAWMLWIVFLLPVAQVAASWHALSHVQSEVGGDAHAKTTAEGQTSHALHLTHCDLCAVAAAIDAGAPLVEPAFSIPVANRFDPPLAATVGFLAVRFANAYLSRAPPSAPR